MKQILRKAIDVRAGEGKRLAIMASYSFVLIASYDILKPMTRSLFVSNLGAAQLPILYMLMAVVVGVFVLFYLRFSASVRLDRLIFGTIIVLLVNLLIFRGLIAGNLNAPWLYYLLFIWTSIYGVVTTTQFWLLANYLFNAREAKRLFPLLTAGAIFGGIMGGYFTSFLVAEIGTPNLAFVCMGLLGISILLMKLAWRWREITADSKGGVHPAAEPEHSFRIIGQVFSHIRHSKHLSLILAVVGITFMVVQIAEFQFVAFASERNTSTDDLTGFLGFWLSSVSIFALFFQIGFANLIIRRFGVGVTILFLPIALLLSSALLLMSYSFVTILSLKFADRAFRHSINRVGSELLFLPIPQEIKKETKAFVDMFGDRFARGLAGLLLIVFYSWLGLSVSQISLVSIVLILLWIVISMAAYREYVDAFRQALAKRRLDPELISVSITDEATINSLIISLGSRNTRQVVYALGLLETVEGVDLVPAIRPLLQHRSPEIRFSTLQLIRRRGETELQSDAEKLLHDEDENVQREAVRFFAEFSKGPVVAKLKEWLHHEDRGLRGAAVYYMAKNPKLAKKLLKPELVQSFLKGDEQERRHIAAALGVLKNESYFPYLHKLLQDPVHTVQVEAIKSAGQTRARDFVPILVQHLDHRDCRLAAAAALALHGDSIIETLIGYFCDDDISINIRMRIPRVIMLVGSQKSAEVLLQNIEQQNQTLRYQIIKALNQLRARLPDLKFDKRVDQALLDELKKYYTILATLHTTEGPHGKVRFLLLERVLQERLDDHIDRIFRLLGLRYPSRDIYNAYAATTSDNRTIRANAAEFLDNILSNDLKQMLLPIIEGLPAEQVLQKADDLTDVAFADCNDALVSLIRDSDPLLSASAIFEIGTSGIIAKFEHVIREAQNRENSLVKETADLVIREFA